MTRIDTETEALVPDWLTLSEVAGQLDVDVRRIRLLLQERRLLSFDRGKGEREVPAAFVGDGQPIKGLHGTLTVLADAGYGDVEALGWLFTPDDSLPGTPVRALAEDRGKEVKRRAQALGF